MKRFRRLLAVVNGGRGDHDVTRRAVALAKANKARLTFCSVHDATTPAVGLFRGSTPQRTLDRLLRAERKAAVDGAVRHARENGQSARGRMLEGKAFLAVIQEVLRDRRDLVIFPDDEPATLRSRLFGSTALHLLRKCPCPVWILRPTSKRSRRFKRILAAVNAAADEPTERPLNIKVLQIASSLAERESAEVHVVHCWTVLGETILASPRGKLSPDDLSEYRRRTRRRHREALADVLAPFEQQGHVITPHLCKGDPGLLVPEVADAIRADLVVMGTVARTGIDGIFIGNTAEQVLQRIGRSVLAVKPDDFVSPVTLDEP